MDASLPWGVPSQVPLQVEAWAVPEIIPGRQGAVGVAEVHAGGVLKQEGVNETNQVKLGTTYGGSNVLASMSKDGIMESRLFATAIMISPKVPNLQHSAAIGGDVNHGEAGPSKEKRPEENGASKGVGERDSTLDSRKLIAKEFTQVRTELQLPMRQLARKGGMSKAEAAAGPKNVSSIADAVKEGILKKEREQDKKEALEAVMAVHGRRKQATGHVAKFPGAIGPESGRLCQCCNTPETPKSTIFCDKCERGFHVECVKLWPTTALEIDVWHCGPCGLQPGHYWPLGRVLISYKDAVAEFQKYNTKSVSADKKNESLIDETGQEKFDGVQDNTYKVKDIRDFKKEARKGQNKGNMAGTPSQPVVSRAESVPTVHMHVHDTFTSTVMRSEHATSVHTHGGISQQPKTYLYPGYVPIQPRPQYNSTAPIVNFLVPPDATVVRGLISPIASVRSIHQPATALPYTKYTLSDAPGLQYAGPTSTHATPTKITYMTTLDSPPESQKPLVVNQHMGITDLNVSKSSNLPSTSNQSYVQHKTGPPLGPFNIEVSSTEDLRPAIPGVPFTEREELLREAKESLTQLRTFISAIRGNLGEGWEVVLRRRPTGAQEKFYLSPLKRKYRSRLDVGRYLGLVEDPRCQRPKSMEAGPLMGNILEKTVVKQSVEPTLEARNLPMFCGDIMIEKLGAVDCRPTYSGGNQIWPVGFRSSWHDTETGSYCISEVGDGGDSGPVFRVTRKLVIGHATTDNGPVSSTPQKSAHCGDESTAEVEKASVLGVAAQGSGPRPENVNLEKTSEGHQAVIDLTESAEEKDAPVARDIMDERYSFLDVKRSYKTVSNGMGESGLEKLKTPNYHSELPTNVIDLSDGEDDIPPALTLPRDILDAKYSFLDVSKADKNGGSSSPAVPALYEKQGVQTKEVVPDYEVSRSVGVLPPVVRPLPNILMEELSVEARTSADAWKLFAKQFVEHCKKSLGSGVNCTVPILEATDEYVVFNAVVPDSEDGVIEKGKPEFLTQKSMEKRETTKALMYAKLEKRLGEDRFGLSLSAVQRMIEALHVDRTVELDIPFQRDAEPIVNSVVTSAVVAPSVEMAKMTAALSAPSWRKRKRKHQEAMSTNPTDAVEEPGKNSKASPPDLVASHQASLAIGEKSENEKIAFHNEFVPAIVMLPPAPAPALLQVLAPAPAPVLPPVIVEEPRQPPPAGLPVLNRLPPDLVGDLLQVWEFLCRFSELLGQELQLSLEDLEEGLVDMGPVVPGLKNSNDDKEGMKENGEKEVGTSAGLEGEKIVGVLDESGEKDTSVDIKPTDGVINAEDIRQDSVDVGNDVQHKGSILVDETQTDAGRSDILTMGGNEKQQNASEDGSHCGKERKNLEVPEKGPRGGDNSVAFPDGTVSRGLTSLAGAHIPLLKFLMSDLKFRVQGSLNEAETDEPKKRGRRRVVDIGPLPPEFGDDLPMNSITWPELAHRYLVALLDVKKQGDLAELAPEERKKLVRFFEGDGGVMGGAVEGIVGVESDAQVLAEAEKELSVRMPKQVEKDIVIFVPQEWDVALTPVNPAPKKTKAGKAGEKPDDIPKWVEALEPVRKMPTNLGTKIKIQVQESLDCKPPEWAKATLDWSLSKGTFKSNAAGPTKRAVLEVLAQYHGEELKAINAPRVRKVKSAPSAEHLMQRCRIVLREVAKADTKQVFCNLVGGAYAVKSSKPAVTVARPLDFRTVDARLAAGAYGGSTDAFAADMRQIWKNVEGAHKPGSVMVELATTLSQIFEKLYLKQVISLIKGVSDTKDREKEKATLGDGNPKVDGSGRKTSSNVGAEDAGLDVDGKLGKAPWEDDTTCRVCGVDEDYDSILLCDGCDAEYHIYCLVPPLEKVPAGNWFCPSCVAVEEGFPEAPALGEAEVAVLQEEMEKPVAGSILRLEFEDDKPCNNCEEKNLEPEKPRRLLRSGTNTRMDAEDVALLKGKSEPPAVESSMHALLSRMEEKEYWQLTLSDRLFLLKFLCDEALKTPQVRAHLEKSVDVGMELHQQLRDLIAERLKIVVPMNVANHGKPVEESRQRMQVTGSQTGQSAEGKEANGEAEAVAMPTPPTLEDAGAFKATSISLPQSNTDAGPVSTGEHMPGSTNEEILEEPGKVMHDLDLNVVALREPETETSSLLEHKPGTGDPSASNNMFSSLKESLVLEPSALSSRSIQVEDTKKRNLLNMGTKVVSTREIEQLPLQEDAGSKKRFKLGSQPTSEQDFNRSEEAEAYRNSTENPQVVENETRSVSSPVKDSPILQHGELDSDSLVQPTQSTQVSLTSMSDRDVLFSERTSLPNNSLKRSLETDSSTPCTSHNGLDNGKKAKREEEVLVTSTVSVVRETVINESANISPSGTTMETKVPEDPDLKGLENTDLKAREGTNLKALEEEKAQITALQSARELDEKIMKLGSKLFNSCLRREHMGTDHLGREYWALTGADQRPRLVVAEMIPGQKDEAYKGNPSSQGVGLRGIGEFSTFPPGKDSQGSGISNDGKQNSAPDWKPVDEIIRWYSYEAEKSLDELVKWLSPRCQQERALRVSIYHWRRSVYPRHLVDMPEALNPVSAAQLDAQTVNQTNKEEEDSGDLKETPTLKEDLDRKKVHKFPMMKATNLLQKRHVAATGSGSEDMSDLAGLENQRKIVQKNGDLRRCGCLEPLWTSRNHCEVCHETYESTADFQLHLNDCPPGSKPTPENRDKETQSQFPSKARKSNLESSKSAVKVKRLASIDKEQDLNQRPVKCGNTRSERAKRSLKRGGSQPTVVDDINVEAEETAELLSTYAESLQAKKTPPPEVKEAVEHTPSNGIMKELEQLIEPSSEACYAQPPEQATEEPIEESREENGPFAATTFTADDWGTNSWPEKFDVRRGKELTDANQLEGSQDLNGNHMDCVDEPQGDEDNRSQWVNDLNANRGYREDVSSSFEYEAPAPVMFSTPDSTRERVSQIGFSDQGPMFTLNLHNSPAFDPSLIISTSPDYPCMEGFPSLEHSNPTALQFQQLMPPQPNVNHITAPHTNFLLSLNDASSRPVSHNQYPSSLDNSHSAMNYQQFLPPHESLSSTPPVYTNFLPAPEAVNSTPAPFTNFFQSLESANAHPSLYTQYPASLENTNLSTISNLPSSSYPNMNTNYNRTGSPYASLNSSATTPATHFTNLNSNSNPSLYSNLNINTNPPSSSYPHFASNNSFAEPEPKRFDLGRFTSNLWFDAQNTVEPPMTVERPAIIPTKPTARRTSTWDYLTNIPLPPNQASERFIQKHHVEAPGGHPVAPAPPIEVGSLPFDLMFEKPHRDLNATTVPEDISTLTLDLMFGKQQVEGPTPGHQSLNATPMEAASLTLDLMFERQEQERQVFEDCQAIQNAPGEAIPLSIDLMSVPEEQMEVAQDDPIEAATTQEFGGDQVDSVEAATEAGFHDAQENCVNTATEVQFDTGQVDDPTEAAATETCFDSVQVDDPQEAVPETCLDSANINPADAATEACIESARVDTIVQAASDTCFDDVQKAQVDKRETKPVDPTSEQVTPAAVGSGGKKPVKRFPVVDASVRSLVGEQRHLLQGLQICLLDMEAATTTDVLENSRASPVRRRAWRAFVKSATCIYDLTKATILLEHMVKAEYLKPNWGYWSSLSAAARSSSLSSLALRLFALDYAITYERVKAPGEGKEVANPSKSVKSKKKKPLEMPPKKKKK